MCSGLNSTQPDPAHLLFGLVSCLTKCISQPGYAAGFVDLSAQLNSFSANCGTSFLVHGLYSIMLSLILSELRDPVDDRKTQRVLLGKPTKKSTHI